MNVKNGFYWLYEHGKSYNVFVADTDDYDDEEEDANVVAKYQRYSTRLYVILLFVSAYLVFYATLLNPTVQTVTVSNLNENIFNELSDKYGAALVCPCSSITIPYRDYLSNEIEFDPICSSLFVENDWVHSFYLVNASDYQTADFRSVAHAQFELLSDFCSICKTKIVESESKFLSTDFVRINLVTQNEIESEMNGTIKVFRESLSNEMKSFLNYLRIYIQSNYFVSSLNTNLMLATYSNAENSVSRDVYLIYQLQTGYAVNERADLSISLCGKNNPIVPIGFYPKFNTTLVKTHSLWSVPKENTPIVDGFFAGCTPLEGILSSTLDCLYDIECIHLLSQYFPSINRLNLNDSMSTSRGSNLTVYDLFVDLFVQQWSTKVNYSSYFSSCSPMSCSYTRKDSVNWSYAITMFFGLYGGLTIILRILSPLIIQMLFQVRNSLGKLNFHNLSNLNIFKNRNQRSDDELRQQKLMTRLYLFLVLGCLLGFVLYSSLTLTNITTTILNPSLSEYKTYENLHTDRFRCLCSNPIISYQSLIQLNPTLHSICSSDFVSDRWLQLATNIYDYTFEDWRNQASAQFNLLSRLCQLANSTISGAIQQFLLQSLITTNVLSENELNIHINSTLNSFFESTMNSFVSLIKLVHLSPQIDQLFMGLITTNWNQNADPNTYSFYLTNNQTNTSSLKVMFQLPGVRDVNLSSINCICAKNASCQSPIAIYQVDYFWNSRRTSYIDYIVPGSVIGCSNFDSLLFSQLYCFYSDSDCYSILMSRIKDSYLYNVEESVWFDPQPLIYNQSSTRFPKNTSISVLINQIMIEQWNPSYSYETFYELCSPNYCTYSQYKRTNTIVSILIILLSLFGGLTISLKIITPWIIKSIYRQRHDGQGRLNTIKLQVTNSMRFIRNNLIELNIFSVRHIGNHQNQFVAKQIGIWSTRLFFSLFLLGLVILIFYSIFQLETVNLIFENPSLQSYQQLQMKYKEQLKCSCSNIALKYEHFVGMKADFHQICGSEYLSSEWRIELSNGLNSNLSVYASNDYRRFVLAHFEYLNSLCTYSIDLVNDSIKQFLNYAFITYELLTKDQFNLRLNSLIEQQKQTIPNEFLNLFSLIKSINHRDGFVSMYGSNYKYVSPWYLNGEYYPYIPSRSISYDDQCSCSLQTNCSTKPFFIYPNSSQTEIIGLKMGCSPTQSMHISTLECFYDEFCVNLLRKYTNLTTEVRPLSVANSQYSINTTIYELIENLFVEQWETSVNYSLYYHQCSPSICSYTYVRYFNIVYLITILLGFQGGLTVILLWISPKIVRILMQILNKIRNNRIQIHAVNSNTSLQTNSNQRPNPNNERKLTFIKLFVICIFLIVIIVGLILFSVYIARQTTTDSAITLPVTSSTTPFTATVPTSTTTTTTTTTTTELICQLQFNLTLNYRSNSTRGLKSPFVADFNNDTLLDIVFFNYGTSSLHVLLGDGRGNYSDEIQTYVGSFTTWAFYISSGDFDHDENLDIVMTSENRDYVYFLFGFGNGSFYELTTYYMGNLIRTRGIGLYDFDQDSNLDVALASQSENTIFVLLGYGNGSFADKKAYYAGPNTNPSSVALADMNNDGYQDIVYNNIMTRTVGVLLGNGDGTFRTQIKSSVGGYYNPSYIAIGNFNNDRYPDVTISYSEGFRLGVVFGYGNGSMSDLIRFPLGNKTYYERSATGDLNNDGFDDIVAASISPYVIYIYISDGHQNFNIQSVYTAPFNGLYPWMNVADFNNDHCQDILASDDTNGAIFILLNTCLCQHN